MLHYSELYPVSVGGLPSSTAKKQEAGLEWVNGLGKTVIDKK